MIHSTAPPASIHARCWTGRVFSSSTIMQAESRATAGRSVAVAPFRFMAQSNTEKIETYNTIGRRHVQDVGVFCMTDRRDHPLMWSHYGDKHTGVCVEFASDVGPFQLANKVAVSSLRCNTGS
ncbi:DUF2971 domain-containing protein (plasmid) [Cupriavidus basilensis]